MAKPPSLPLQWLPLSHSHTYAYTTDAHSEYNPCRTSMRPPTLPALRPIHVYKHSRTQCTLERIPRSRNSRASLSPGGGCVSPLENDSRLGGRAPLTSRPVAARIGRGGLPFLPLPANAGCWRAPSSAGRRGRRSRAPSRPARPLREGSSVRVPLLREAYAMNICEVR